MIKQNNFLVSLSEGRFVVSIGSLGIKVGMTQIFDEKNASIPVTLIKIGPCTVTQIKTVPTDGYNAVQLGYDLSKKNAVDNQNKKRSLNKALEGHLKKSGALTSRYLKEYHVNRPEEFELGQTFDITNFSPKQFIDAAKTDGGGLGHVRLWLCPHTHLQTHL